MTPPRACRNCNTHPFICSGGGLSEHADGETCPSCGCQEYEPVPMTAEEVGIPRGAQLIMDERIRQMTEEAWTPEHDDAHHRGELVDAAIAYAASHNTRTLSDKPGKVRVYRLSEAPEFRDFNDVWPSEWQGWDKRKETTRERSLVKAGALIAAELDRLEREVARRPAFVRRGEGRMPA